MNTWECPVCSKTFTETNQYHICESNSTAQIMKCDTASIGLYHILLDRLIDFGIRFETKNSANSITFMKESAFAVIRHTKNGIVLSFALNRVSDEIGFDKIQPYSDNRLIHTLVITDDSQVNITLVKVMKEAFHLVA